MRALSLSVALLAFPFLVADGRAQDPAGDGAVPLPVDRTQKLIRENAVYSVEGRVRVPKGVEITVLRNVKIVGKGSGPAVIEVEGGFDCIGVFSREVILENVTVEPCAKFERIHMDMAVFRGTGGIRTPKDTPVDGYLFLENFDMCGSSVLDVWFQAGSVKLSSACFDNAVKARVTAPPGKDKDQVRVFFRGCTDEPTHKCTPHGHRMGFSGGLEVDGGDDVTIQLSRVAGGLCAVRNWGKRLIFDGIKVKSSRLEFHHEKAGSYQRVQCAKCDIYSGAVRASAPPDKVLRDTFVMDRCWWGGIPDPRQVLEKVVTDGADEPETNGVRVVLPKVNERPLELAGPHDR
jgi:hypothetical protein